MVGCYGGFNLTKKVYKINGELGAEPIQTVVMWLGTPIYGLTLTVDFLILNSLEYWTGSNPVSLEAGEIESQTIVLNGKVFNIEVMKEEVLVSESTLSGDQISHSHLIWNDENNSWNQI